MQQTQWILYDCYGYSGELRLKEAMENGLRPVVARPYTSTCIPMLEACLNH